MSSDEQRESLYDECGQTFLKRVGSGLVLGTVLAFGLGFPARSRSLIVGGFAGIAGASSYYDCRLKFQEPPLTLRPTIFSFPNQEQVQQGK